MKQKIFLVAGGLVSVGCLYWVFKDVSLRALVDVLGSINLLWVVPALVLFYVSMYLRCARWAVFFRPNHQLTGRDMVRPLMIGFAFNNILPSGRVGEVVRAYLVGKTHRTGLSTAMATIVTERIFDGVTLFGLLGLALAALPEIDPEVAVVFGKFEVTGAMLAPLMRKVVWGCAILVAGVVVFMFPPVPRWIGRVVLSLPFAPPKLRGLISEFIQGIARGFDAIRGVRNLATILAYSLGIWGLVALSNLALAYGFAGVPMNLVQSAAIMGMIAVFILLPAAPGYWGLYEAGVIFGLKVLGIQQDESISTAYALSMHLIQFLPIVAIGLYFAAQSQVKWKIQPQDKEM